MTGKLSQPGCHTNTATGGKTGRSLVKLAIAPASYHPLQKGYGKSSPARSPVMRGAIHKPEKMKKGKKILGKQSSFLQFSSKPVKCSFESPREGVLALLQKFHSVRKSLPDSSSWHVAAAVRERFPHYNVNRLHNREGNVPGVEIGDCFKWRAELSLVGLHRPPQAGIDWKDISRPDGHIMSVALSVVVSGVYEDDVDEGETLTYTGEGGNDLGRTKRQCQDQKLEGGNLALRNSAHVGNQIRLIRGRPEASSPSGMVYSYDGLYKVVDWLKGPGISSFNVYKFKLVREPGQEPLRWHQISPRGQKSESQFAFGSDQ